MALEAEQLEVALLEDEGKGFREGGVRHAGEGVIVYVIRIYGLLHIVAHLVDRDVVALVVHTLRGDARAQEGLVALAHGAPGVAGAPCSLDGNLVGYVFRIVRCRTGAGPCRASP